MIDITTEFDAMMSTIPHSYMLIDSKGRKLFVKESGPVSPVQIEAVEKMMSCRFPDDYKRFLMIYGGTCIEDSYDWAFGSAENGIECFFGIQDICHPSISLTKMYKENKHRIPPNYIPIGELIPNFLLLLGVKGKRYGKLAVIDCSDWDYISEYDDSMTEFINSTVRTEDY